MPEKNTPITMKDIARELKVSVATVSRALKDSPRISAKRRDEIRRYAEEHNFSPNIIAESLRNRRVIKVIGVIVPQFTHFYFSSVLSGIEEEADKYGYRILVAQSLEQYDREVEVCRSFYENKVCGILVSQAINTSKYDHFTDLINKNVPLVFFDRICTVPRGGGRLHGSILGRGISHQDRMQAYSLLRLEHEPRDIEEQIQRMARRAAQARHRPRQLREKILRQPRTCRKDYARGAQHGE